MANKTLAGRLDWNQLLGFEQLAATRGAVRANDPRVGGKTGIKIGEKIGIKIGVKPTVPAV